MNSQPDPLKANFEQGYYLGVNIRTRANTCKGVAAPLDITEGLPVGVPIQGLYAFDTTLLAFAAGNAFYRSSVTSQQWVQISGFAMSATAAEIDCCAVPASTVNFIRTAAATTTQTDNQVIFRNPIAASPQCLIVMDGETQPRIIFPDSTTRLAQTYAEWTSTSPEYVPIARYPAFVDGVLYCVGKDLANNWTQIYHSVTGRPLDFVILLDQNGNKISDSEVEGGAGVLANRVSYNPITALQRINTIESGFVASTLNGTFLVVPDYTTLIAAEPTFTNTFLFDIGATGKNSIVDVLGDTTVVCRSGIRSFNAVQQLKWQGKNAPFSASVNNFISAQEQTVTAGISFDDYAFYALSTRYGPGVLVYDFLQQAFVSIDLYKNVGLIKQFAKVQSGVTEQLFFYTTDNKVYQAFAGGNQRHQVILADLAAPDAYAAHRVVEVNAVLTNVASNGYAESYVYSDRVYATQGAVALLNSNESLATPGDIPFNEPLSVDNCQQATFNYQTTNANGYRATVGLAWDCSADLLEVRIETANAENYANKVKNDVVRVENEVLIHISNDCYVDPTKTPFVDLIQTVEPTAVIGSGNHAIYPGDQPVIEAYVAPWWGTYHNTGKFFATPGPNEFATVQGEPFYRWLRQGPDRWSITSFGAVNIYFLNSGYSEVSAEMTEQLAWLQLALANSTAAYNVVVMYDTVESSNPTVTTKLAATPFKSWGVQMILTGAGGMYERIVRPDGLVIVNNGCGGSGLYTGSLAVTANSRVREQNKVGYVKLTANPLRLTANFISNGVTYDTTNL